MFKKKTDYRAKLIEICKEHNISLQEYYFGDKLRYVEAVWPTGKRVTQHKINIFGDRQNPYEVMYKNIAREYSARVVRLV
jgi:hypothetical protein